MPVKNRLAEMQPEIAAWRRDIHENPELMYDLPRTSALVAAKLREFGCDEVVEGIGRSGVVGVIKGRSDGQGRAIGLRADMDALPIHEATGLPYASKTPGKMHACGHDGHTAMLLGAAKYLAETRNFDGRAVVIFQPAEEGGAGGLAMCEDGLMARFGIEEVYGMHNMPGIPVGAFAIRPGPIMAATDEFDITVTGKGGHAAKPHECIDTTLVASHIVVALQSIASRNADPLKQIVVSVCTFRTESEAYNVIPQTVELKGTVRTLEEGMRDLAEARVAAVAEATAAAYGATAEVRYQRNYPVTANAPEQTDFAAAMAEKVSGRVDPATAPLMGGEDFSYMLLERPGAYIFLGNGDTASVHHPAYNFDDEAIPFGSSWYVELVENRLPAV
ncbi:amidohydrolase [Rhodovulum sp. BSW8]|uniref:Amidohydrolase n=1 Tax=Rhodovulum visakhapatnamense TaxID=364297 RepID=A0ABS1RJN0_9RHOB|nr:MULTISPECIES: M20 aminoacylase family protein [Rhodovulum]MBL3571075.1 amidohydrolase [Rhodovulum visakhapatnamense]MBL3578911.1 amidohydrolase [Rhodovulum visakhapatnamense]OLS45568.1 amidohydrolase [Rhodovulum sulfidophilum]RBO54934.1 amidohydrolase [Rhodovulum sp. BSW8]